jgi:hypothetical protein
MKFTILRLVEKGKSCVKGRVCCHKPLPIFAIVPQSFEAVSLHQKFYQNHFGRKKNIIKSILKTMICGGQ